MTPTAGTDSDCPLLEIAQIAVNVRDIGRATAFYREALELSLQFQTPTMAFFECGAVRLMLSLPEKPEFDHPASILYFRVADIDKATGQLATPNCPVVIHEAFLAGTEPTQHCELHPESGIKGFFQNLFGRE